MAKILDACCGSRMFWFDKNNPLAFFIDNRQENHILCDGRALQIKPDSIMDFRDLAFSDNYFKLVIFDPPHLKNIGRNSWMAKKYGALTKDWQDDIRRGFKECFRVLAADGVLIFKWNETQIKVNDILALTDYKPLIGHKSGKNSKTHWLVFMKIKNKTEHDK